MSLSELLILSGLRFFIPEAEIDKPALGLALRGMTDAQRAYKSIAAHFKELIAYLGAE